jgi:1,4-dihydroxy-2-naphthoyl-CoA synthase
MSTRLQISIENHVAEVVLNRPEKHNAVDMRMFDELAEAGKRLSAERSVRSVVLTGAGENFCAGIDVSIFKDPGEAIDPASMAPQADSDANRFQRAAYAWREIPVPVVCAIRGVAFGAPGARFRCRSFAPSAESPSVPARRSRSARTCGTRRRMRNCRSWKYAGGSFRTSPSP